MSEPINAPPPPPGNPPPAGPAGPPPSQQIQGPAIGLMVTAGLGGALQLLNLIANLFMSGAAFMPGTAESDQFAAMFSGGLGIVFGLIALAVAGFIFWAALQMKALESYQMAFIASIVAMIPCISPCCLLGIPIGIWALVVLNKPEVKAAFRS